MDWLHHPSYRKLRDRLVQLFQSDISTQKRQRPVVFLCGAQDSNSRDAIAQYIRKRYPNFLVFYAEHVWDQLIKHGSREKLNALSMEQDLAHLSDIIIIIVESAGTIAELGAFSGNDDLRKKIIAIVDKKYQNDESFINTGPIHWINQESEFRPTIYCDTKVNPARELDNRLSLIPGIGKEKAHKQVSLASKEHDVSTQLLFLLCDIVAVIGPASRDHCEFLLNRILGFEPKWKIDNLLAFGTALSLFSKFSHKGDMDYYFRPLENGKLDTYQFKTSSVDLARARAEYLSIIYKTAEFKSILANIREFTVAA